MFSIISLFVGVLDLKYVDILNGDLDTIQLLLISRLPRLLAILCTGVGMSVAGLVMQQLCSNKFVSPSTSATISSAKLGILMALVILPTSTIWIRALFAFVFAILGTWIFVLFIQKVQFKDVIMVPLVGMMFGNVVGGFNSFIAFKYELTQAIATWEVGNFSMVLRGRYEIVYLVIPFVILAFIYASHFNIVGMGKDFSSNLGVNYNWILFGGITICAVITASIVVIVGTVSFVGLIIPNIVTMFKGDKLRGTMIDTALSGALFVLICDIIARLVIAPYEVPINLIIGVIGSIAFIVMLLYRLRNGNKAINIWKIFSKKDGAIVE